MSATQIEEVLKDGIKGSLKAGFKERRGKLEIMVDVLSTAREGARKTEIVYKANLNFNRAEKYLPFLKEKGLMENSGPVYKTTEKGKEFLRGYQKMTEFLLT